jgi:hypothetical protein
VVPNGICPLGKEKVAVLSFLEEGNEYGGMSKRKMLMTFLSRLPDISYQSIKSFLVSLKSLTP